MSVVNTADIVEVMFAADRLDVVPMTLNIAFWSGVCIALVKVVRSRNYARSK